MIFIPELEKILITPPKTASTSLRNAIFEKYPRSYSPWRHMEADGVPAQFASWSKHGLVRQPIARLWSLYNYCSSFAVSDSRNWPADLKHQVMNAARLPFVAWCLTNRSIFASSGESGSKYETLHPMPENKKSQEIYLRPDLGTDIWPMDFLGDFAGEIFSVTLKRENCASCKTSPPVWAVEFLVDNFPHMMWDAKNSGGWL